ncbi:biotin/methionine sulfoxide reductase [Saccharopolyspora kobensis]|uniref:Biotin/methionine sulfoxide reductase n=3 Tax=Saccharopolyspora kobensis TaxID=146035 RepID=A0A1H5X6L8_9PSEU|nr:molybdopterin-dependent oxidoreductase [Saccharopolyspora kobensis]SEG07263.1 biotin/methionine sulfoxide reductase [Saccharopolyspora kobensis]SFE46919.1 biotin/methionine sulfoxide reductase [Saccharopolyspora kobensis]
MSTEHWRPSSTHWGAFRATTDADGTLRVQPHPADPAPSPLLGNLASTVRHRTRVRRPAIRRGWLTGGPGPTSARGHEEFVEVGWDTALDLVAEQLERTRREHGNEAIFGGSYGWASAGRFHHAQSQLHRFHNTIGGYTASRNNYSFGTSQVLLPHVIGSTDALLQHADSWATIREHTDLVVAFGGLPGKNLSIASGGITRHTGSAALRDLGTDLVAISPLADDVPAGPGADWWPIAPGTDVALQLGLAHTLLTTGRHDQGFLDRCCTGSEVFTRYLLGDADGIAKSAEWAAGICGIDAAAIRALAERMAAGRTLITVSWSLQRTEHGEQPVWAGLALAAMLGQIGLPGGGFGHGYGSMADVGDDAPAVRPPALPLGHNPVQTFIPVARIADLLLNPGQQYDYDGRRLTYPDIRLVHWAGGNPFHHHQDLNRLRRAFGRPDTVVVHETHWTATARHADVVFPATTALEREDVGAGRRDSHLIAMHQVLDPVGEARDDYAVLAGLAQRLGTHQEFTEGRSPREWLVHLYEQWRAGLVAQGHDVPPFAEFWAAGDLRMPDVRHRAPLAALRSDPQRYPLPTPSGRIELFSATIDSFGYPDCPGHPVWLPARQRRGGPLHLIANQPPTRLHGQGDVGELSQRAKVAGREPIRIHPQDAAAREISDGDVVRVFNHLGACLAGARVSEDVRPGVVVLPTGAWFDPQPDPARPGETLCAHGNPNVLTADVPSSRLSQGCAGQHAHVEVERHLGPVPALRCSTPPPLADS